uniref:RAVE complex protein Rav1 C-terminal domain-containing protein n=1 Tax=Oryza punctata TaxID=4537 RepID=A0A0E0JK06_ORYPU
MGERDELPPLPLALHPPHLIPPPPTADPRALSFLPDLGGLPWVAYAAASFLVVSHLPSPPRDGSSSSSSSSSSSRSGGGGDDVPFFRQAIDLRAPVSAVAWCRRGGGELAAAAGSSVSVFQPAPSSSPGSFGWVLRWAITETFAVTAVAWTGSGDGILLVGEGVAMWARTESSWKLTWRFSPQVAQSLASATHFLQGPVATAAAAPSSEGSVPPVMVFVNDAKVGVEKAELVHPKPVSMIQWRPRSLCVSDQSELRREILMTCCLDGTLRLWSEDEVAKSKKHRVLQRSFSVIAVIEMSNTLNGVLGVDITVRWAIETGSVVSRDEEGDPGHNQVGKCEWLADVEYSCLCWAPSVIQQNRFLVLGSEKGADCFVVSIQNEGDVLSCQKMFTIPFFEGSNAEGPPDSIHTIPLASNCDGPFVTNSFVVVCLWRTSFQALSWKVVLHLENQNKHQGRHGTYLNGDMFSAVIYEGSSVFPACLDGEYPTCISATPLNNTVLPLQQHGSRTAPCYHIATGYSDGTVKLWKMSFADNPLQTEKESHSWQLVGMFCADRGPITAISLSNCGRVATVGRDVQKNTTSIHIWKAVKLMGDGSFLLEDALVLQGPVVGLDWLSLGDGRFLLAVYLLNELHIYSHKHPSFKNVLHTVNSKEKHLWSCIALFHSPHDIASFLWGPKATGVLVHKNHLALFSSWLVRTANKSSTQICDCPAADIHELPCSKHFNENVFGRFSLSENYSNTKTAENNSILLLQKHSAHCSNDLWNLLDIAAKMSGPLASYHPRALIQSLYSGQWKRANTVLQHLVQSMKANEISNGLLECSFCGKSCHNIPECPVSESFTDMTSNDISNRGLLWGDNQRSTAFSLLSPSNSYLRMEDINTTTSTSQSLEINNLLATNVSISTISDMERTQIVAISDLLGKITDQSHASPYKSLDEAGRRFWVAVQFQRLYALRRSEDPSSAEGFHVDSASIAWALQSDCQDDLLNSVLPAEPSWSEMRNLGVGLWYTNVSQLRTRMEKLARLQYLKSKDPKDCALLYIALNRTKVLVGLFKISRDEKDKRLYEFLSRNFQEEKHKAAALKNAYVLMGRHQWELAIAFFLLGGDTSSAISVCAKNLQDEQLAIVICRLLEGSGGPLERNLIANVLLREAVDKGDHWLSSLLEWMLGNYSQSVNELLDCHLKSLIEESSISGDPNVFADPGVGQYCAIIATKNSFRNCVGEAQSANLSKLSLAMAACALNRCGLPLEALEYLCCNSGIEGKDNTSLDGGDKKIVYGILNPFHASSNWLSASVVSDVESNLKITMASKYLSRMLRNQSLCSRCSLPLTKDKALKEFNSNHVDELSRDVKAALQVFDKKFSLKVADIADKILTFCCNDGIFFLAYVLLWGSISSDVGTGTRGLEGCAFYPIDYMFMVSTKESCKFLTRYVVSCCFMCSALNMDCVNTTPCTTKVGKLLLKQDKTRTFVLGRTSAMLTVMDLLEYNMEFSFSWLCHDIKALLTMTNPVIVASVNRESFQVLLDQLLQAVRDKIHGVSMGTEGGTVNGLLCNIQQEKSGNSSLTIDEKWHLIGISLWTRLSSFMKQFLTEFVEKERLELETSASDVEFKDLISSVAAKFLMGSLHFVSSLLVKLHASFLRERVLKKLHSGLLFWLSQQRSNNNSHEQFSSISQLANSENIKVFFDTLWEISAHPVDICTAFVNEEVNCFPLISISLTQSWKAMTEATLVESENNFAQRSEENRDSVSSKNDEKIQRSIDNTPCGADVTLEPKRKGLIADFERPRELLRRNGELLEAICLNSINEQQGAIATSRKGLVFFNWNDKQHNKNLAEYIWAGSDWPLDGWAGCESTPTSTSVSPSVGLGRRKGSHLSSGGSTISLGSLAKPGRDLTGGGAFGIPGYAGIGASGFGWGEPDEFEDFVDPPATLENIHSRALSRHPSLPLLLVGSSNTHVYLWEFGKDSAMATYGVLPAANIPPPYALASISAVQFDYYGQRFATAALDGTVCTWQVEVGGRSNVHPIESSLCFNTHASDVAFLTASGSVLAAAGCSSNGANVVIWDTLAPPSTCQSSIMCHEGGVRSLSVFDRNIGCGSISPLIVTGGKSGDVTTHDLRFISTGKTKHHRSSNEHDVKASSTSMHDTKSGTSNGVSNSGMIWHIPKAHTGSVSSVSTIPNTSLFLTGSKDGDVKLWDAKSSQLVFHWQKLHERHTFFQPTSRGFGGVVRAAVTDIQVLSNGFVSCGGDGSVKLVQTYRRGD